MSDRPRDRLRVAAIAALLAMMEVSAWGAEQKAGDKAPEPAHTLEPAHIDVAHSAQLRVEATESNDMVALWIRRAADKQLIAGKDVTVTIDGKPQAVAPRTDGSFTLPVDDLRGKQPKPVEIIVGHDGIREILSGQLPPPPESGSGGILGSHNQLAWWIINIAVLLIGAVALSRRKSY